MAETEIYSAFRSHWDNDNDLNPAESGSGVDTHTFTVPAGKRFSRYALSPSGTMNSTASVPSAPAAGATGQQTIQVNWHFNSFGKITYTLKAYEGDAPVSVTVGQANWAKLAADSITQRKPVRLSLKGPDALAIMNAFRSATGQGPVPDASTSAAIDSVAATVIIAVAAMLTVVAIATLTMILLICLYAIYSNYYCKVLFKRNGPLPYDDELNIELDPR